MSGIGGVFNPNPFITRIIIVNTHTELDVIVNAVKDFRHALKWRDVMPLWSNIALRSVMRYRNI